MNTITDADTKDNGVETRDTAMASSNGRAEVSTPVNSTTIAATVMVACSMPMEASTKAHGGMMLGLAAANSPGKMEQASTKGTSLMTKCTEKAGSSGLVVQNILGHGATIKRWAKVSCSIVIKAHTKVSGRMMSVTVRE